MTNALIPGSIRFSGYKRTNYGDDSRSPNSTIFYKGPNDSRAKMYEFYDTLSQKDFTEFSTIKREEKAARTPEAQKSAITKMQEFLKRRIG
jgi:hypothetical protein